MGLFFGNGGYVSTHLALIFPNDLARQIKKENTTSTEYIHSMF